MDYNFADDLRAIREILGYTQFEIAEQIGVEQVTISRNELHKTNPSNRLMELVYNLAFDKKIQLNRRKFYTFMVIYNSIYRNEIKNYIKLVIKR